MSNIIKISVPDIGDFENNNLYRILKKLADLGFEVCAEF